MQLRRGALAAAAAAAAVAVAVAPASGAPAGDPAHARKTAKVTVADDYYAPTAVKIKKDNKVKWTWAGDNLDTHNVVLGKRHPNGVKKSDFSSRRARSTSRSRASSRSRGPMTFSAPITAG